MTSVVVALLQTVLLSWRSRAALHAEILALRHQLQVLQRSRPQRIRLTPADRALWVWLSRIWSSWRTASVVVKPATVVAWHRQGFQPGVRHARDRSAATMSITRVGRAALRIKATSDVGDVSTLKDFAGISASGRYPSRSGAETSLLPSQRCFCVFG